MKRPFTIMLAAFALAGFTATSAYGLGEVINPGTYQLCSYMELAEHHGVCPVQETLPQLSLRAGAFGNRGMRFEEIAEPPAKVSDFTGSFWAGWCEGEPGHEHNCYRQGILNSGPLGDVYEPMGAPGGVTITVWVYPVVEEARGVLGPPCTVPAYLGCGHMVGVFAASGASVTYPVTHAPLMATTTTLAVSSTDKVPDHALVPKGKR